MWQTSLTVQDLWLIEKLYTFGSGKDDARHKIFRVPECGAVEYLECIIYSIRHFTYFAVRALFHPLRQSLYTIVFWGGGSQGGWAVKLNRESLTRYPLAYW
jgi:hypothetical protein